MKFKQNVLRFIFFITLFIMLDFVYLFTDNSMSDYENLTVAIMSSAIGYNNLFYIPGIVITVIYVLSTNQITYAENSAFIIRKGKNDYIKYLVKKTTYDAVCISLEFVGAVVLVCALRFKQSLLIDLGFYQCCCLYALMLCCYYLIVGIVSLLIKIMFNFNKLSCVISIALFVILAALILINIKISPIYFSEFIKDWFYNGSFNVLEYAINVMECIVLFFAIYFLLNIVLMKKDMIFNER